MTLATRPPGQNDADRLPNEPNEKLVEDDAITENVTDETTANKGTEEGRCEATTKAKAPHKYNHRKPFEGTLDF